MGVGGWYEYGKGLTNGIGVGMGGLAVEVSVGVGERKGLEGCLYKNYYSLCLSSWRCG